MSTREETRQLRLEAWKQIFADHAASGLSVKAYCEANNIKKDQYFYCSQLPGKLLWQKCPKNHQALPCSSHRNMEMFRMFLHQSHCQVRSLILVNSGYHLPKVSARNSLQPFF